MLNFIISNVMVILPCGTVIALKFRTPTFLTKRPRLVYRQVDKDYVLQLFPFQTGIHRPQTPTIDNNNIH